jgi:hypothetical protein
MQATMYRSGSPIRDLLRVPGGRPGAVTTSRPGSALREIDFDSPRLRL